MQLSYVLNLPHDTRYVPVVRRLVVGTLTELEVEPGCIDDIALALTEACTNVVQHGERGAGSADLRDIGVEVAVDRTTCRIRIRDVGEHFQPPPSPPPSPQERGGDDPEAELLTHGRGVELMRHLVDQLSYVPDPSGTTVVLVKELSLRPGSVLAAL